MKARRITTVLMIVTAIAWIGWDVHVAANGTPGDTESEIIRLAANRHPFLPFGFGILMAHFFWNALPKAAKWRAPFCLLAWQPSPLVTIIGLPVFGLLALGIDLAGLIPWVHPAFPFVLGVIMGRILWPQRVKL